MYDASISRMSGDSQHGVRRPRRADAAVADDGTDQQIGIDLLTWWASLLADLRGHAAPLVGLVGVRLPAGVGVAPLRLLLVGADDDGGVGPPLGVPVLAAHRSPPSALMRRSQSNPVSRSCGSPGCSLHGSSPYGSGFGVPDRSR